MIKVVNKRKYKGSGLYIGRPSLLGNPYSHLDKSIAEYRCETREESIEKYLEWMRKQYVSNRKIKQFLVDLAKKHKLGEEIVLVCWCKPLPCHGDVLKTIIEKIAESLS